jgi:hypothetical protein
MTRILNQSGNWALGLPRFGCYKPREGISINSDDHSMACSHHHGRGGVAAALLTGGLALAACSGTGTSDMFSLGGLPSWFTSPSSSTARNAQASAEPTPSMDDDCPVVDVRTGASTLAIATKTEGATANDMRYQLSFNQMARQCFRAGATVRMRVGVQGRLVVGPAGAPAQADVPVRYAVVREGVEPKTIVTKFRRIPVAIPSGTTNVPFTDIEEDLSFPMPSLLELQAYVVYVGFDDVGDRAQRPAPAKKKASPRPK